MMLLRLAFVSICALCLAGCTTSKPVTAGKTDIVRSVRGIANLESLVGVRGATKADQAKIDGTIAGGCAVGALTPQECRLHGARMQGN